MVKRKTSYICQNCGAVHTKWAGQCEQCQAWNQIIEEKPVESAIKGFSLKGSRDLELSDLQTTQIPPERYKTHIEEFDRVCGGGLVEGSAILIGGDPGIGKSTLLLQVAAHIAHSYPCLYISGEESAQQVRLRACRLKVEQSPLILAAATNIKDILHSIEKKIHPKLIIIDSIQTMYMDVFDSAPGTVGQVRACAHELIKAAKKLNFILLIVGHVTKEGTIAGPRVLEHMVDTVLYFEGDRSDHYRMLRTVKNRFGATNEIGLFEMATNGLQEVKNPSFLFLSDQRHNISGSCVYAGMEGTRPILVEIQALLSKTSYGTPRRTVVGWDNNRLAMLLAVLESRCGLMFGSFDVFLNIAGGLKIYEPAADLAVAGALISAYFNKPLKPQTILFGEVALSGEVRPVQHTQLRLKEAEKLGFESALLPFIKNKKNEIKTNLSITIIEFLKNLVNHVSGNIKNI